MRYFAVRNIGALVLAAGLLSACSAANAADAENLPAAGQFKEGTCQSAAEDVLGLAGLARRAESAGTFAQKDRQEMRDRQARLGQLRASAEPEVQAPLTKFVTSVGWVRIRMTGNSFDKALVANMDAARRNLQAVCVG